MNARFWMWAVLAVGVVGGYGCFDFSVFKFDTDAGGPADLGGQVEDLAVADDGGSDLASKGDMATTGEEDLAGADLAGTQDFAVADGKTADAMPDMAMRVPFNSQNFQVDPNPQGIAAGDFDQDGKVDLVVTSVTTKKLALYKGSGNGGFIPGNAYVVGTSPTRVVAGDFDGDGKPDIVMSDSGGGKLLVFFGDGNGALQLPPTSYTAGVNPLGLLPNDLNGDGKPDVIVMNQREGTVGVYLNQGNGTLAPAVKYMAGTNPEYPVMGDLDGDGKPDLVVVDNTRFRSLVLGGNGDGTFRAAMILLVGPGPEGVALADFDRNGSLDVAAANFGNPSNQNPGSLYIILNQGQPSVVATLGIRPSVPLTRDWDKDGRMDVVVLNEFTPSASVLFGNGDGTFQKVIGVQIGTGEHRATVADFNGDGKPDIALTNSFSNTVNVLINTAR